MLEKYLRKGETIESRLDELMTDARASGNPTLNANRYAEAQVLATLTAAVPPATIELAPMSTYITTHEGGEKVYAADDVAQALDNAFEGGQAPVALKGAVLALLTAEEDPHLLPLGGLVVSDSSLVPDDADGRSAMVEGAGRPTIDRSGVDFDQTIPEHDADEEMAERLAEEDDFPEFAEPEADPLEATTKKAKKGGKKTAAQRAAEEAGL